MPDDRDRVRRLRDRTPTTMMRIRNDARLDAASAELEAEIARSKRATAQVEQFVADVDSDKISTDGLVVEPFEEEDTLVRHVRAALHDLAG